MKEIRGLGKTTQQIRNAPKGATFIWCHHDTRYPKDLARALNREDLIILPLSCLDNKYNFYGITIEGGVIIDHSARLESRQRDTFDFMLTRVK